MWWHIQMENKTNGYRLVRCGLFIGHSILKLETNSIHGIIWCMRISTCYYCYYFCTVNNRQSRHQREHFNWQCERPVAAIFVGRLCFERKTTLNDVCTSLQSFLICCHLFARNPKWNEMKRKVSERATKQWTN